MKHPLIKPFHLSNLLPKCQATVEWSASTSITTSHVVTTGLESMMLSATAAKLCMAGHWAHLQGSLPAHRL